LLWNNTRTKPLFFVPVDSPLPLILKNWPKQSNIYIARVFELKFFSNPPYQNSGYATSIKFRFSKGSRVHKSLSMATHLNFTNHICVFSLLLLFSLLLYNTLFFRLEQFQQFSLKAKRMCICS